MNKVKMTIQIDPLKDLHEQIDSIMKDLTERALDRYCGVCFFGNVVGNLCGIPICSNCMDQLFPDGIDKASPSELGMFQKVAMLGRDSREALYLEISRRFKKEDDQREPK